MVRRQEGGCSGDEGKGGRIGLGRGVVSGRVGQGEGERNFWSSDVQLRNLQGLAFAFAIRCIHVIFLCLGGMVGYSSAHPSVPTPSFQSNSFSWTGAFHCALFMVLLVFLLLQRSSGLLVSGLPGWVCRGSSCTACAALPDRSCQQCIEVDPRFPWSRWPWKEWGCLMMTFKVSSSANDKQMAISYQ